MTQRIVLGTAGHIDHGKTTLIKTLTGIDTDRLKEEKRRGITIELGFAHLDLGDGQVIGIVDVPGHERFVRHMVAGATGIDLVALVIAADEGIMPQTREHIDICQLLGVKAGLVVLTKADLVDDDWLKLVQEDVRDYLSETFLKEAPLSVVSAVTGQGLDEFKDQLARLCAAFGQRRMGGPFRLPIDRVFTIRGFGTVVSGTSLSGRLEVGAPVIVYPSGNQAKVRGLQVHDQDVTQVSAGLRTAINLQGIERDQVRRGEVVASPRALIPSRRLAASLRLLSSAPRQIKNRTLVNLHLGTAETRARVVPLSGETIQPGEEDFVQFVLEEPVACLPGDHFVIRAYSPSQTIGGGEILSINPPRRKRSAPETLATMALLQDGQPADRLALLVHESRLLGRGRDELAASSGLTIKELEPILAELMSKGILIRFDKEAGRLVHADHLASLSQAIEAFVADYHAQNPLEVGPPKEELKTRLHLNADPKLVTFQANALIAAGRLEADDNLIALAGHTVSLASDLSDFREKVLTACREGGLRPPRFKEVAAGVDPGQARSILNLLLKDRRLVKLSDDLFYDPQALSGLEAKIIDYFKANREMSTQDFKELGGGLSRKYLIPLAEHFDRVGVTIRVGEVRRLRERLA